MRFALCLLLVFGACTRRPPPPEPTAAPVASPVAVSTNWTKHAVACDAKTCKLQIKITVTKACFAGDLDILNVDVGQFTAEKAVLLSVEALSNNAEAFAPVTVKIPLEELNKGGTYSLAFPKRKTPVQLGVFLCKDSEKAGHCASKRARGGTKLLAIDFGNRVKDAKFMSPDSMYYFQYGFLDGGTLSTFPDMTEAGLTEALFDARQAYVASRFGASDQTAVRAGMLSAKSLSRILQSMPLTVEGATAVISLPKQDPSCH